MTDFDFRGLSPRSFEQLIQAIAVQTLGPGVTVFGDGPDGGREATFSGPVPFPNDKNHWDGYGVIQAKFRIRPTNDGKDATWLTTELEKELKSYSIKRKKRKKPAYYILVTNVVLSSVAKSGGKDKTRAVFEKHRKALGLIDYQIWDYDQLATYLRAYSELRKAYTAWITPGDVLAEAMKLLNQKTPEFDKVISNFLQKEFFSDQYARLEQAGHSNDDPTPLARVFVDLPITHARHLEPPHEKSGSKGVVLSLLEAGSARLNPSANETSDKTIAMGRYVLIGGPGQGKSTVAQYLSQLYRAALIDCRPRAAVEIQVRQALADFKEQCKKEEIPLPSGKRFPIRIVLSRFATALSGRDAKLQCSSLLDYIVKVIGATTTQAISAEIFREWLSKYPWLIIFDGLDEVPASSNRADVLSAIQDFWIDAAGSDADVLVVGTTRPQGYNDDFSPTVYQHWWLAPLSNAQALHYADRLVGERHKTDADRRAKINERLRRAASQETTSRLMRSPLQITILAALVDQIGQAPRDRWRLFNEYYQVIYRRETEREAHGADILSSYKQDIDAIHERVGLVLQVASERSGGTDSRLTQDQLERIVRDRLADRGHEGAALTSLTESIVRAAELRLVFLVSLEDKRYGFEIRSFQEFMAAEALVRDSDELVLKRLSEIAPVINWRNVFLFAAGKCFTQREHLSGLFLDICAKMNDKQSDAALGYTKAGSRLALDILSDGLVSTLPRHSRTLAREALKCTEVDNLLGTHRLPSLYSPDLDVVFREELENYLMGAGSIEYFNCWPTLTALISRKVPWASELAERYWPKSVDGVEALIQYLAARMPFTPRISEWLKDKIIEAAPLLSPTSVVVPSLGEEKSGKLINAVTALAGYKSSVKVKTVSIEATGAPFQFTTPSVQQRIAAASIIAADHTLSSKWALLKALCQFSISPGASVLSEILSLAASDVDGWEKTTSYFSDTCLSWPLLQLKATCRTKEDFMCASEQARAGKYGDVKDWMAAESRWEKEKYDLSAIEEIADKELKLHANIGEIGIPIDALVANNHRANPESFAKEATRYLNDIKSDKLRKLFSLWVIDGLYFYSHPRSGAHPLVGHELMGDLSALICPSVKAATLPFLKAPIEIMRSQKFECSDNVLRPFSFGAYYGAWFSSAAVKLQEAIAQVVKENPAREDLLVLSSYLVGKARSDIPKAFIDFQRCTSESARVAFAKLLLYSNPTLEQATEIAAIFETRNPDEIFGHMIFGGLNVEGPGAERVLTLLEEKNSKIAEIPHQSLATMLEGLISQRQSGLQSRQVWANLALPLALIEISESIGAKQISLENRS